MKAPAKSVIKTCRACRVCGSRRLEPILSLGSQYAVGFLESAGAEAERGPLDLVLCNIRNGGCGLLQLKHTFDHDLLYRRYWYKSGISTTMVQALGDIVHSAEQVARPRRGDLVIDIGANDGTLLRQYRRPGLAKVGFEPSNLWKLGRAPGTTILHDYFNAQTFTRHFPGRSAKIITSIAMFYDLEDPNAFVADIKRCLADDGLWIIQMNYLGLMLSNRTYDNISHEHLEYYSLISLQHLLKRHALEIADVELNDVNGGSYRVYVRKPGAQLKLRPGAAGRVRALRARELRQGYDGKAVYTRFSREIAGLKRALVRALTGEAKAGRRVYIYGASTRGLVVLQHCGVTHKLIAAAVDKNKDKWGRYIVGTGIQVIPFEDYRRDYPDTLLVLPYQFRREIILQERAFLKQGGRMIFALPRVEVVTARNMGK